MRPTRSLASLPLLLTLATPAQASPLLEDVASSCRLLEGAGSSSFERLRLDLLSQMLACRTPAYFKEKAMSDPKKREKKILRRDPKIRAQQWPEIDSRYRLTHLDKLIIAHHFVGAKVDPRALERDPGDAIFFELLHRAIDPASLSKEIAAAPFLVGSTKGLLEEFYSVQARRAGEIEHSKTRAPAAADLFSLATSTYRRWQRDFDKHADDGAALTTLAGRLHDAARPSPAECESPISRRYEKRIELGIDHPLSTLAVHVMHACAKARGDVAFAASFSGWLAPGSSGIGPLGGVQDVLHAELSKRAAAGGSPPRMKPPSALRYDFMRDSAFGRLPSASGQSLMPSGGPLRIQRVRHVEYKGVRFVIAEGDGMSVRVPVMSCRQEQQGWKVDGSKLVPKMMSACTFTGKHENENLKSWPALVPAVFARGLKKGAWVRLRRSSGSSDMRVDASSVTPGPSPDGLQFAVPVVAADTLDAFTAKEGNMAVAREDLPPLLAL